MQFNKNVSVFINFSRALSSEYGVKSARNIKTLHLFIKTNTFFYMFYALHALLYSSDPHKNGNNVSSKLFFFCPTPVTNLKDAGFFFLETYTYLP